jgi:hypothetical protein
LIRSESGWGWSASLVNSPGHIPWCGGGRGGAPQKMEPTSVAGSGTTGAISEARERERELLRERDRDWADKDKERDRAAGFSLQLHGLGTASGQSHASQVPQLQLSVQPGRRMWMWRVVAQLAILVVIVLILLWDLRKVKRLSDTIHNDHKQIWVDMNQSSFDKWYTPFDLCLLEQAKQHGKPIDAKLPNNTCSKLHLHHRNYLPSFCALGSSLGSKCNVSPMQTYFRSQLRDYNLGPFNQNLARALRRMAVANKPLVFIGDVISRQNFNALLCEILKTRQVVLASSSSTNNIEAATFFNASFRWKSTNLVVSVYFMHLAHVFTRSISTASLRDRAYDHDPRFHPEYSDARIWDKPGGTKAQSVGPGANYSFRHHKRQSLSGEEIRTSMKLSEMIEKLNDLLSRHSGLVIVANVGVWYNTRERFRAEILPFVQILSLFGKENLVFFRETSAQHWNHTSHGYFINGGLPEEGSCQPLKDSSPQLDWRNREVQLAIGSLEQPETVRLIDFRDVTAPLAEMHPNMDSVARDCTRFCYFPQMWQTVWRDLEIVSASSPKLSSRSVGWVNGSGIMSKFPDH